MFFSNREKELLGRYFKYIREKNNIRIYDIPEAGICDYKTYKDIEKGIIKKNDDFYDDILKFYNINYSPNSFDFNLFDQLILELYESIEILNHLKIREILNYIENDLKLNINCIFYKEFYESIHIIKKHYLLNEYLSIDEIKDSIDLINLWDNHLSSILIEICEKSNYAIHYNYKISNLFYENIKQIDAVSKYWYARECIMHQNYIEALEIFKEVIFYFDSVNNYERKVLTMLKEFSIYRDIDCNKARKYIKNLEIILKSKISDKLKENICYSIAMFYYFDKNYKDALSYYNESFKYNNRIASLIFIYSCESRLKILKYKNYENNSKTPLNYYLKYFELKANNAEYKELEKYIMNDLIPILLKERYKEPYWTMFEYELNEIVTVTRSYKYLKIYNQEFHNSQITAN